MESSKAQLVSVARAMLEGQLDLVAGVRRLMKLLLDMPDPEWDAFDVIRGVESETDDLPVGEERALWNSKALAEKDIVRQDYEEKVRPVVLEACTRIVERFGE
ncbi:MAG TPA: DUF2489 domain-containing protein [Candidatus Cybelea sp.]|jgi:hypothetical protein|nr:DUF2489 domain-containing protein [Candidatus Cybelea sp.]